MKTPVRILTVEDFNPSNRFVKVSFASLLRLKGCWFKGAGFHAGNHVKVTNLSPGVIELRVSSPVQIDASYLAAIKQLETFLHESP